MPEVLLPGYPGGFQIALDDRHGYLSINRDDDRPENPRFAIRSVAALLAHEAKPRGKEDLLEVLPV
jgi:hypothetical protein